MKKLVYPLSLLTLFLSFSSYATQLDFTFNVNSSGPSIYPCDAGIRHVTHTDVVCYDRTTQSSCQLTQCEANEDCNCICTGGNGTDDTDYTQDFFNVSHTDWVDNSSPLPTVTSDTVVASNANFSRIFADRNEWAKQLTSLTFNFGSERYGAEFYLDVCYRGPQIDFNNNGAANKFRVRMQSTITDLISINGLRYSELSDLKVRAEGTCDLQGLGSFTTPATDDPIAHQITGVTGGDTNFSTQYSAFNAGGNLFLLNQWINNSPKQAPRFCKIRYYFSENMRNNTANPLSQIRKWQNQKSRISTFSEIASKRDL